MRRCRVVSVRGIRGDKGAVKECEKRSLKFGYLKAKQGGRQ